MPLLLQVLVFGQDPMKAAQPAAHAKKRRKGCGVFNHYADGSGEWVRSVHSSISHYVIIINLCSLASQHLRTADELYAVWRMYKPACLQGAGL